MLVALEQDVPEDIEAEVDNDREVLVCLESAEALLQTVHSEVLLLDLDELVDVVLELVVLELKQVVVT